PGKAVIGVNWTKSNPNEIAKLMFSRTMALVSPGKPEEMAVAILQILSNQSLAEEMGNAGYERLLREFSLKKNVELTENLYDSVLS
ncbi:MAG: glycosyltransferase, partial [Erysipelotrichaceae bacterium]|nr:glycosyltransferase [Erysipelotrichaceae bacterium]